MKLRTSLLCLTIATLATATASAKDNTPKGKPFVAIEGQIVEVEGAISSLQDQVDLLVEKVDTLEQRMTANESAITTLYQQNSALHTLVQQNISDVTSIQAEINSLQAANQTLQESIAAASGDIDALQGEVSANQQLIASLQSALIMVNSNVISLNEGLQAQIDNNVALIEALQVEIADIQQKLEMKQNVVDGVCPENSAIKEVMTDGSVVCEAFSTGSIEKVISKNFGSAAAGGSVTVYTICPSDYVATSTGFGSGSGWEVTYSHIIENPAFNGGLLTAKNLRSYTNHIAAVTTCIKITP